MQPDDDTVRTRRLEARWAAGRRAQALCIVGFIVAALGFFAFPALARLGNDLLALRRIVAVIVVASGVASGIGAYKVFVFSCPRCRRLFGVKAPSHMPILGLLPRACAHCRLPFGAKSLQTCAD